MEPEQNLSLEYLEDELKKLDKNFNDSLSSIQVLRKVPNLVDALKSNNEKIIKPIGILAGLIKDNSTRVSANQKSVEELKSLQEELEKIMTKINSLEQKEVFVQSSESALLFKRLENVEIEAKNCENKIEELNIKSNDRIIKISQDQEKDSNYCKNNTNFYTLMLNQISNVVNEMKQRMEENLKDTYASMAQEYMLFQKKALDELNSNRLIVNCIKNEFDKSIINLKEEFRFLKEEFRSFKEEYGDYKKVSSNEFEELKNGIKKEFQEIRLEMRFINSLNLVTINEKYNEILEKIAVARNQ